MIKTLDIFLNHFPDLIQVYLQPETVFVAFIFEQLDTGLTAALALTDDKNKTVNKIVKNFFTLFLFYYEIISLTT